MRTDPALGGPRETPTPTPGLPGRHFADGVSQSGRETNRLFLSAQGRRFVDASGIAGLDAEADGRAFAWLDYDRDGWLDVAAVNANSPLLQLFRNELGDTARDAGRGRVIAVSFVGSNHGARPAPGRSSRDGYGARVEVDLGDQRLVREHRAGEGLAAQNAARLLIGIGAREGARAVTVHWPSGRMSRFDDVAAGTHLRVFEDPGQAPDPRASSRSRYAKSLPRPARETRGEASRLLPGLEPASTLRVLTTLATWCEACREEIPELRLLRERFTLEELRLYGVPVDPDDTRDRLGAWTRRHRPPYEVLELPLDERDRVRRFVETTLRRDALPASVVTDGAGRVLASLFGAPTVSDLRALLAGLEGQSAAATSKR